MVVPSLSAEEAPYVAGVAIRRRARRPVVGSLAVPCCSVAVAPAPPREKGERTKEHRLSSSAPRSVRSLGDVRGEEGGGKAGSGREERHEERAGEKEEARQGAARSRWGAPSCRAGFGVSASFIVGFVRVVIVGQEWLRQVQQSSRTRGTDSIGDAICLMVLQLLGSNLESGDQYMCEEEENMEEKYMCEEEENMEEKMVRVDWEEINVKEDRGYLNGR